MTVAILLLVCVVFAGAVVALVVTLHKVEARLAALEKAPAAAPVVSEPPVPVATGEEFVITRLGDAVPEDVPAPTMETRLFADVVLRESVVMAASWIYAVRRGLSPENRNRIRFEMRREVKRARKRRKAEEREAIREWRARRRAAVDDDRREDSAA